MKTVCKKVRDYFNQKSNLLNIDAQALQKAVNSLSYVEQQLIEHSDIEHLTAMEDFIFHKAFYRQNDICAGCTDFDDEGNIILSAQSAITELEITLETYQELHELGCIEIDDVKKDEFPQLSLESLADLTAAILKFETNNQVILDL